MGRGARSQQKPKIYSICVFSVCYCLIVHNSLVYFKQKLTFFIKKNKLALPL